MSHNNSHHTAHSPRDYCSSPLSKIHQQKGTYNQHRISPQGGAGGLYLNIKRHNYGRHRQSNSWVKHANYLQRTMPTGTTNHALYQKLTAPLTRNSSRVQVIPDRLLEFMINRSLLESCRQVRRQVFSQRVTYKTKTNRHDKKTIP